ncbi:stage V sporulation protein D [Clostridium sp.]|uniref:stage V sporulation protein D n=1 Tax=Clostridium sp. TaxID=1506 RepID=UPI003F39E2BD
MKAKKIKKDLFKRSYSKGRAIHISFAVAAIFSALILRLGYIMIVKGDEYKDMAEFQWNSKVKVEAKRGDITDRNGVLLATSIDMYRVDLDLNAVRIHSEDEGVSMDDIAKQLADAGNLDFNEVKNKLDSKNEDGTPASFATLVKGVEKDVADRIKALKIYGVVIGVNQKRYYPNNTLLSHVLGGVNLDSQGINGVELQYDNELSGIHGYNIAEVDGSLRELPYKKAQSTTPVNGKDVTLTIDENMQLIAEKVAKEGMDKNLAKEVSILVMNPNNGEILAMVNKPDFNPNNPYEEYERFPGENDSEKLNNMFKNSLVSNSFEPGSTFKTITMIAAIEEGLVSEHDTFNCTGGVKFGDITVKCWNTSGHGVQTVPEILQNSCNVGFMELGARLGNEKLKEYIDKLGFGVPSPIDLPNSAEGIVKEASDMSEMDLATIAFGQTNTATGIQLMTAFNAIANGGDLIQPHIMKEVSYKDKNGTKIITDTFNPTITKDVLSDESTATLRDYLEVTINQGGPPETFMKGYRIGAKTGTAEKVDPETGSYSSTKYIPSVVGLYPVENPQITIFIKVDEPSTGQYYGGTVATPLLKSLMNELLPYMDSQVYKERNEGSVKVIVPELRGKSKEEAKRLLAECNLKVDESSLLSNVVNMSPIPGSIVTEGSIITLDSNEKNDTATKIIMPNVVGKSLEDATVLLNRLGIQFVTNGTGQIYQQSIGEGKIIDNNVKVKLDLR